MRPFLNELQATLDCGIYSPVVLGTLMIPEACGAVQYPNEKNGVRYKLWYDEYVGGLSTQHFRFDGEVVWKLRNGMLHETSLNLKSYGYDRVLFTTPNPLNMIVHMGLSANNGGIKETSLTVYLPYFFKDVKAGTEKWLSEIECDANSDRRNLLGGLIQYRPNGLEPHIVGLGLIA